LLLLDGAGRRRFGRGAWRPSAMAVAFASPAQHGKIDHTLRVAQFDGVIERPE